MSGKMNTDSNNKFMEMYRKQMDFQERVTEQSVSLPLDNPQMFQYHMTAMTEELGEVLKADKRWKTHRNSAHDPEEKLDEIADCFITMMNVAMWSGFSQDEVVDGILNKITTNNKRLDNREGANNG